MPIKIGGGLSGGTTDGGESHSDWVGTMEKMPQANGGVPMKIISHMTGNNSEGIEGGIDIKGMSNTKSNDRKVKFADGHDNAGGIHRQY